MKTSEKQNLKKNLRRIGLFMLIVLVPNCFVCVLLMYLGVAQWLNIFVLVVLMFALFFLYTWVMQKLDRKKEERLKNKKDPFSD